jgi:hypothetical protein
VPQTGATFHFIWRTRPESTMPAVPRPGATSGTLVWTGTHPCSMFPDGGISPFPPRYVTRVAISTFASSQRLQLR